MSCFNELEPEIETRINTISIPNDNDVEFMETTKAYGFKLEIEGMIWIPKSQVTGFDDTGTAWVFDIPTWLVEEKGLENYVE